MGEYSIALEELERLESRKKHYQGLLQASLRQIPAGGQTAGPDARKALQRQKSYQSKIEGIDGRMQQLRDALRSRGPSGGAGG